MTKLLCGTGGFCQSIEMVFKHGFKSSKFFSKKLFVWDYIGRNLLFLSDEFFDNVMDFKRSYCCGFIQMSIIKSKKT